MYRTIENNLNRLLTVVPAVITLIVLSATMSSCSGLIYDDEGDCEVTYRLRFRYDMNLKWADAFANEVKSIHLYAFDTDGHLVWETTDKGAALAAEGYSIQLPLAPGQYKLVAWCGTDNDAADQDRDESFAVTDASTLAHHSELQCSLRRGADDEHPAVSKDRLFSLFHGMMDLTLPAADDGEDLVYTMPLTKDTNHVRIILQHLSGEDVDANAFTFHIDDENGLLGHDNKILDDEVIRYRPWAQTTAAAGVGKPDAAPGRANIIQVNGAIADMTVSRLSADHRRTTMLTVRNQEGALVAHVPIIDYALLAKEYYQEAYGHYMTDQDFLDREDDYVLTFFIDENNEWVSTRVLIHSWVVVPQNHVVG